MQRLHQRDTHGIAWIPHDSRPIRLGLAKFEELGFPLMCLIGAAWVVGSHLFISAPISSNPTIANVVVALVFTMFASSRVAHINQPRFDWSTLPPIARSSRCVCVGRIEGWESPEIPRSATFESRDFYASFAFVIRGHWPQSRNRTVLTIIVLISMWAILKGTIAAPIMDWRGDKGVLGYLFIGLAMMGANGAAGLLFPSYLSLAPGAMTIVEHSPWRNGWRQMESWDLAEARVLIDVSSSFVLIQTANEETRMLCNLVPAKEQFLESLILAITCRPTPRGGDDGR